MNNCTACKVFNTIIHTGRFGITLMMIACTMSCKPRLVPLIVPELIRIEDDGTPSICGSIDN